MVNSKEQLLQKSISEGEQKNGSVEFKYKLYEDIHLKEDKKVSLLAQLKYRLVSGENRCEYVVGVTDEGELKGITKKELDETIEVLRVLAIEINAYISNVYTKQVNNKQFIGLIQIKKQKETNNTSQNHLIIGTAGHVDHGKSSLVGSLVTNKKDDGKGKTRAFLDVQKHEIERGLSADLSYSVYGFNENNKPINVNNPNRKEDNNHVVTNSKKLISFVDTVGHKPWLRTTIRGIFGQKLDYGILVVSAIDGPTETTKEHLGLLLAKNTPIIIPITKVDIATEKQIKNTKLQIEKLLHKVDKKPIFAEKYTDTEIVKELTKNDCFPIIETSSVTRKGYTKLNNILANLPKQNKTEKNAFKMYIDKIYTIKGIGTLVSGVIKSGSIAVDDEVYIGPIKNKENSYKKSKVKSIEIHNTPIKKAKEGQIVSIALSNITEKEIKRGMVIVEDKKQTITAKKFKANVFILNHPTSIRTGYEPVLHIDTISEVGKVTVEDFLISGDKSQITFEFKFNEYNIEEGQKFIFREGSSKGIGTITEVYEK